MRKKYLFKKKEQEKNKKDEKWLGMMAHTRIHMERPMAPAAFVAEDGLIGHQREERLLAL